MTLDDISAQLAYRRLILLGDIIVDIKYMDIVGKWYTQIFQYRTVEAALIHYNLSVELGLYYESGNYHDISEHPKVESCYRSSHSDISLIQELLLDKTPLSRREDYLDENQIIEIYNILKERDNRKYCKECGGQLFNNNILCYACEKGI